MIYKIPMIVSYEDTPIEEEAIALLENQLSTPRSVRITNLGHLKAIVRLRDKFPSGASYKAYFSNESFHLI